MIIAIVINECLCVCFRCCCAGEGQTSTPESSLGFKSPASAVSEVESLSDLTTLSDNPPSVKDISLQPWTPTWCGLVSPGTPYSQHSLATPPSADSNKPPSSVSSSSAAETSRDDELLDLSLPPKKNYARRNSAELKHKLHSPTQLRHDSGEKAAFSKHTNRKLHDRDAKTPDRTPSSHDASSDHRSRTDPLSRYHTSQSHDVIGVFRSPSRDIDDDFRSRRALASRTDLLFDKVKRDRLAHQFAGRHAPTALLVGAAGDALPRSPGGVESRRSHPAVSRPSNPSVFPERSIAISAAASRDRFRNDSHYRHVDVSSSSRDDVLSSATARIELDCSRRAGSPPVIAHSKHLTERSAKREQQLPASISRPGVTFNKETRNNDAAGSPQLQTVMPPVSSCTQTANDVAPSTAQSTPSSSSPSTSSSANQLPVHPPLQLAVEFPHDGGSIGDKTSSSSAQEHGSGNSSGSELMIEDISGANEAHDVIELLNKSDIKPEPQDYTDDAGGAGGDRKSEEIDGRFCQVCGDNAAGFHCGAYVCEACKVSLSHAPIMSPAGLCYVIGRVKSCHLSSNALVVCLVYARVI